MFFNVNVKNRNKGAEILIVALYTFFLVVLIGYSLARLQGVSFSALLSSEATMQAQYHARNKMDYLVYKGYDNLVAQSKTSIAGSSFKDSVSLGIVYTDASGLSSRLVTVNVYKDDEVRPRATLERAFYSNDSSSYVKNENSPSEALSLKYADDKLYLKVNGVEKNVGGGVPVGTIIAWPGSFAPTEGGTWLLCNGQSCSAYPALVAVVGSNVPNLEGRFLEGTISSPRIFKDAGLPNITGTFGVDGNSWASGSFYKNGGMKGASGGSNNNNRCDFDASISSSVYGKSDTVQPASYTVRYYIKAA